MLLVLFCFIQETEVQPVPIKVYFISGKDMDCQSYEIKGKNLIIVDLEGKKFQIPMSLVDMEATEHPPLPKGPDPDSVSSPTKDLYSLAKETRAAAIEKLAAFKENVLKIGLSDSAWDEEIEGFNPNHAEEWKSRVLERAQLQALHQVSDANWPVFLEELRMKQEFEKRIAKQREEIEAEDKRIAQAEEEERVLAIKKEQWALERKKERDEEERMKRRGYYKVTYEINLCGKGSITYHQNDSTMQKHIRSHESITFWAKKGEFVSISAQNGDCNGRVTVKIYVGNSLAKEATSEGQFMIATTSGRL